MHLTHYLGHYEANKVQDIYFSLQIVTDFFFPFFGIIKKKKNKPNQTVFKIHTQEKRVATYTSTDLKVVFDNGTWNYLHAAFAVINIDIFCSFFFWGGGGKKNKDVAKIQPNHKAAIKPNNKNQVWEGRRESVRKCGTGDLQAAAPSHPTAVQI